MDINKTESKDMLPSINQKLPTEMLKKILENLDYKSLLSAKKTCRLWKNIIVEFGFEKQASSRILENTLQKLNFSYFIMTYTIFICRKN